VNTTRTFVAVNISPAVRERVVALIDRLRAVPADVKWVEPGNMHLTLKFLGDVRDPDLPDVCRAVSEAVQGVAPFEITCRGAGAFPDAGRPRTIWLGVDQGHDELADLQAVIDETLKNIGFPKEGRAFHPHLTLGRLRSSGPAVRDLGRLIRDHDDFDGGVAVIDEVVVYASYLDREGPTYQPLGRTALRP
jgi:2'-5' RNA ligase